MKRSKTILPLTSDDFRRDFVTEDYDTQPFDDSPLTEGLQPYEEDKEEF